jgi:ABC-type dipeptide/oligopeptide/nickel transport system permease component
MRALLLPGELAGVLAFLYVFGTFLPAAASRADPCTFGTSACGACSWSNPVCVLSAFGTGLETFVVRMFTGDWGFGSFGGLSEPVSQFLAWWLPYSIELAIVALALVAVISFPLGLLSGVREDSPVDLGSRAGSTVVLLVPTFFLLLVVLQVLYGPFESAFGDQPYGILPTPLWFNFHGGIPPWVGVAYNTTPTGFPIVDSLWHRAWPVAEIAVLNTLIQAGIIALIYVSIYLRYLRQSVARIVHSTWATAARARGLAEREIVWRHTGRRLLPLYLSVFATTVPAFLGTLMVVEVVADDPGVGRVLVTELLEAGHGGFGFSPAAGPTAGNFYQVLLFLLVAVVLLSRFAADVLTRWLDPRLVQEAEG